MTPLAGRTRRNNAATTPLIDLDTVVLDTETTGLDVRIDRIVQIGALRMHGGEILEHDVFDLLVNPGMPVPVVASRVHGLHDEQLADAPGFADVAPQLRAFIGDALVVGHSINYDLALLRHEAARHGVEWSDPRALDVAFLAAGLSPDLVDTSLDAMALGMGIEVTGRHSALGDARVTGRIYAALMPRLIAAGVRTAAEAERLCRKPVELIARQEQAGWFDRPDDKPDFTDAPLRQGAQRSIDSFLYRHRLGEVMSSPPISIPASATLLEAARLMDQRRIGCVIVSDTDSGESGILTERDLLAALARHGPDMSTMRVADHMSAPVITSGADTLLYRVLGRMARRNLRYLGVTDRAGNLAGVFTLRTLLRQRALATLTVGDEIAAATRPRELARVQAQLPALASALLDDGFDARAVASVISAEVRAMTARAAEIAMTELEEAGHGAPPAPFALLVLGSGGRGESLLAPDQDNALVIDDGYAGDLDSPEDWFTRFGTRVADILHRAAIPYCTGGVMASNRPWRRRLGEWAGQVDAWAGDPRPQALLNVDIFFDFAVALARGPGGKALAETLRQQAVTRVKAALSLLRALGESAGSHGTPLGMFGRLRTDDNGRIDLKAGGMLPIVAGARVMALRHGLTELATPARLEAAARAAGRAETDTRLLSDIHGFFMRLVLTQQIADLDAGVPPSNRVDVRVLSQRDKDRLRDALGRLGLMQDVLRDLLQGR